MYVFETLRKFFNTPLGQIIAGVFVVGGLGLMVLQWKSTFSDEAISMSQQAVYIDAETGQSFHHTLSMGDTIPILAPSGKQAGYPAEFCNWTKDGKVKSDPTPVLLNSYVGKTEPTFCPDCNRLVTPRNEAAIEGGTPPPTRDEYMASRAPKN